MKEEKINEKKANEEKTNQKKELICIVCPIGCHIEAELDPEGNILSLSGNSCGRGAVYAKAELTNPVRVLTSTVKITDGLYRRLPVITSQAIPKDRIFDVMKEINKVQVCAPVKINDIVIGDVCGLGVDIISSRSMESFRYKEQG